MICRRGWWGREAGGKKIPKIRQGGRVLQQQNQQPTDDDDDDDDFFPFPPQNTIILNTTKILQTLKFIGTLIGYPNIVSY